MTKVGIRLAAAAAFVAFALGAGCKAEEDKSSADQAKKPETEMAAKDTADTKAAIGDKSTQEMAAKENAEEKPSSGNGAETKVAASEVSEGSDGSADSGSETKVAVGGNPSEAAAASEDDEEEDVDESLAAEVITTDDGFKTQKGATEEDGKWSLPEGTPTFHVVATPEKIHVDWYTYNGYRRYHADCHVCHGPDGAGSTFAPALADSLKTISYSDFVGIVASGRVVKRADGGKNVMPAFGANPNVMCFIDDIYAYLKARATGSWPRLKPSGDQRDPKPQAARDHQKECYGE